MVEYKELVLYTEKYNQLLPISDKIKAAIAESHVSRGVIYVITKHTTTGILVNEKLECLEKDILAFLTRQVPEADIYFHARFLHSYGSMAGNPTGHLKSLLTGNHCAFPILDSELQAGSAQEIYLAEFDGPQKRTISLCIIGE